MTAESQSLQESATRKAAWLVDAQQRLPVGTHVTVVHSDVPEYVGATGTVIDYDVGGDGDWPLVCVGFDTPISYSGASVPVVRDAFYCDGATDDEIVRLP